MKVGLISLILTCAAFAQQTNFAVPTVTGLTRYWFGAGAKGILITCDLTEKGKPVNCRLIGKHTLDEVMQSERWYNTGDWKTKKPELGEIKDGKQWDGWDWVLLANQ